jgi:hypothetical protein
MAELLSTATRQKLLEYFATTTLRTIEQAFEKAEIVRSGAEPTGASGQRRRLVAQYYHSLDFSNPADVAKLLVVYASVLNALQTQIAAGQPQLIPQQNLLKKRLKKDGYVFEGGLVVPRDRAYEPELSV